MFYELYPQANLTLGKKKYKPLRTLFSLWPTKCSCSWTSINDLKRSRQCQESDLGSHLPLKQNKNLCLNSYITSEESFLCAFLHHNKMDIHPLFPL